MSRGILDVGVLVSMKFEVPLCVCQSGSWHTFSLRFDKVRDIMQGQEIYLSEVLGYMFSVCLLYLVQIFTNCQPKCKCIIMSGF